MAPPDASTSRFDPRFDRWSPALRRAVVRVRSDFFAWPLERQTSYRVSLPEDDRAALVACLLDSVPEAAAWTSGTHSDEDRLPLPLQHRINELLQPLVGIGEDAFFLNELFDDGVSILDFPTLRAYDEHDHVSQQRLRAESEPDYRPQPYCGSLHGCWARVLIDGQLSYLTLSMAAASVLDRVEDAAYDELQLRIPHRYVPGSHDGETEGDLIRWDVRTDAGGQEALLDELHSRLWAWEAERWPALQARWTALGFGGAYLLDSPAPDDNPEERNLDVVFTDPEALGRIRFESFLSDVRRIERAAVELEREAAAATELVRAFIAREHAELQYNFDPKVVQLRRRRKVLVHKHAFDDLSGDDDDPE